MQGHYSWANDVLNECVVRLCNWAQRMTKEGNNQAKEWGYKDNELLWLKEEEEEEEEEEENNGR